MLLSSPPDTHLSIGRFIRLLGVMQGCLDIFVTQSLADRRQADTIIDQFSGMGMAQLV
jgi:hypothetical protein